jgi:hypothetical protein
MKAMLSSERFKAGFDHRLIAVALLLILCGATRIAASVDRPLVAQGNAEPQPPHGPAPPGAPVFAPGPLRPLPDNDGPAPAPPPAGGAQQPGLSGAQTGAITGAILGALIGLVLWALRRSATAPVKVDPATGGAVVEFSRGLRLLVLGLSLFTPTALIVAAFFMPEQKSAAYIVLGVAVLLFAGLGAAVCWTLFKSRIIATSDGLVVESGWKRSRRLAWHDVVEVVRDKRSGGLMFRVPSATSSVTISPLMAGLKPLVAVMCQHLPADRYAKASDLLGRIDRLDGGNAMPFFGALDKKAAS